MILGSIGNYILIEEACWDKCRRFLKISLASKVVENVALTGRTLYLSDSRLGRIILFSVMLEWTKMDLMTLLTWVRSGAIRSSDRSLGSLVENQITRTIVTLMNFVYNKIIIALIFRRFFLRRVFQVFGFNEQYFFIIVFRSGIFISAAQKTIKITIFSKRNVLILSTRVTNI